MLKFVFGDRIWWPSASSVADRTREIRIAKVARVSHSCPFGYLRGIINQDEFLTGNAFWKMRAPQVHVVSVCGS